MRLFTMTFIGAMVIAPVAFGQILPAEVGQLGVFADPTGSDCNIVDVPGTMTVYVVHVNHQGAGAVDFRVEPDAGVVATWLSDTPVYAQTIGLSPQGVFVLYGSCEPQPTHVLTITYMVQGSSASCSMINVLPNLNIGGDRIATVLCEEEIRRTVPAKNLVVNPDGQCDCTVGVAPATWGRIKSLYSSD